MAGLASLVVCLNIRSLVVRDHTMELSFAILLCFDFDRGVKQCVRESDRQCDLFCYYFVQYTRFLAAREDREKNGICKVGCRAF